ncbi:N-acetylglucosaminyldiphosphoundecaprenol N-acetyl-beta-D-mannosaminyltransferase [Abditibacteriota bacterium]|nr:N-acetylglucosaminyldiphosphoundecaprenol N-acetyl-beta-D-mannosaminyltransferase [Abditibacteriota bacterium]
MIFTVFLTSAILGVVGFALSGPLRGKNGPRPDGVGFIIAVLLPLVVVWWFAQVGLSPKVDGSLSPDAITNAPTLPPELYEGWKFALLTLAVYVLSALRGMGRLPAWIADVIVLAGAFLAVKTSPDALLALRTSASSDAPTIDLGIFAIPFSMLWIWGVARLCASLARLPAVAPGYIGLVAGLMFLVGGFSAGTGQFSGFACAALCGAGLVTFVLALKSPNANLGWSATLASGFLLGIASALGVLNITLPAIICLAALALGLPLLNVSIVSVRAKLRGKNVEWSQKRVRLDEALAYRGVPPRKIATLYFVMGLWGCWLAYLAARWFFTDQLGGLWIVFHALVWLASFVGGGFIFFSLARVQMRRREGEDVPDRLEAFGIEISPVSMNEALDKIEGFIQEGTPHHVVTSDANAVLTSRSDPEYTEIIRRAALITPDGFGLVWGARLLGLPIYERVTGVDMVTGICERAAKNGYRLYIVGSEEGVASTAARNLAQKYPGANFVGTHHGFWRRDGKAQGITSEQADALMADEIRRATPDVLFVAMGIPSQEKFIAAQLERMNVPVCLGVGGSFDVYSGKFNRAPLTVQRLGMEWLYRVWIDPSRWKRMGYVPKFMLIAVKTWLVGDKKAADVY